MYSTKKDEGSLRSFHAFLKDVRSLWALVFSGPVILPFIAAFAGIEPPWPKQIAPITAVVVLLVLVLTYQRTLHNTSPNVNGRLLIFAVIVFVCLTVHLGLANLFIFTIPTNGERIVLGCGFTRNAVLVAKQIGVSAGEMC